MTVEAEKNAEGETQHTLRVDTKSATYHLDCELSDTYPLDDGETGHNMHQTIDDPDAVILGRVHLRASVLLNLIRNTLYAVSTEDTRYYLNGVFFCDGLKPQTICATSSDGHRMATIEAPCVIDEIVRPPAPETENKGEAPTDYAIPPSIVPMATIKLLKAVLKPDMEVVMEMTETFIRLRFGFGMQVVVKLIDGTFPEFRKISDIERPCIGSVNPTQLINALNSVTATGTTPTSTVVLDFEGDTLTLSQKEARVKGAASIRFNGNGTAFKPHFSLKFLTEMLNVMVAHKQCGMIEFHTPGDPDEAVMFTDSNGHTGRHILMPKKA